MDKARRTMIVIWCSSLLLWLSCVSALSLRSSSLFHGSPLVEPHSFDSINSGLHMRKQKASDRRTRRKQKGDETMIAPLLTVTESPMQVTGSWKSKQVVVPSSLSVKASTTGGRGRSRKRATLYNSLAYYHNQFLQLLTSEYQAEEDEVLGRIKASIDDPLTLEAAGYALFDLYPERRGNIFNDEVYRLTKAKDATTAVYASHLNSQSILPPHHKFSPNDVVMLTWQPNGSGDFFASLPINDDAVTLEARVLNTGPSYVDVAVPAGKFEATFGPAPNDAAGGGDKSMRLRADRFLSRVPYERMVAALAQMTCIPDRSKRSVAPDESKSDAHNHNNIHMDEVIREAILSTHAFSDPHSPLLRDPDVCDLQELSTKLSKPPMASSHNLASQVIKYIKSNPHLFRELNAPQQAAIEAALTRRLTMIQGPPGSGKTQIGAAIAFGFVHQCRTISPHTKVLACAFSNVGADNLAEACLRLGLKIVRVGKPSAVTESLWDYTLEAAIERDPDAQKAMQQAAKATALLGNISRNSRRSGGASLSDQTIRDAATVAVKASIKACGIAATKAFREADVIVATSMGAADPRLLSACGIEVGENDDQEDKRSKLRSPINSIAPLPRALAPDQLPPLSVPFVIVDEACQSVEPATLVPIVSTDTCRSLVMLGDPCQLPPTVRSGYSTQLSLSLMERLSTVLPHPIVSTQVDSTVKDTTFLDSLPIKRARSLVQALDKHPTERSYRKRFGGALLLSVQYRMHPSISAFPSAIFYDGQLSTPASLGEQRAFPKILNQMMPCGNPNMCVRVIDVGGRGNERQGMQTRVSGTIFNSKPVAASLEEGTTYWNEPEAERVLSLINELVRDGANEPISSIGVISPYNGQVQLIKGMIASDSELRDLLLKLPVTIEVKSVDGYQGQECDVIIFSAVRSNRNNRIGFLHDWRRLNVALTRSKSALLVVGDLDTLSDADRHWAAFSRWATDARVVVDDYDSPEDEPSL